MISSMPPPRALMQYIFKAAVMKIIRIKPNLIRNDKFKISIKERANIKKNKE
jgi:hypothetical protein